MKRIALASFLGLLLLASPSPAQDIKKLRLGEGFIGDKPDVSTLKGYAVFVELWGIH